MERLITAYRNEPCRNHYFTIFLRWSETSNNWTSSFDHLVIPGETVYNCKGQK